MSQEQTFRGSELHGILSVAHMICMTSEAENATLHLHSS